MTSVADSLAPLISFANVLGFAASVWLALKLRDSPLAPALKPGTGILVVGQGLHLLNDYVSPLVGFNAFTDDAYDHLFIHLVLVAALVAYALGIGKAGLAKSA